MPFTKESALERLTQAHRAGRLAHAYLLSGSQGAGKSWLAAQLAGLVLECPAGEVAAHPDAHLVQPQSKSRRIVIDQIRALEHAMQRKPLVGSGKVALIFDAERMQPQAANAFLKTLEEPPPGSLIILSSRLPESMLPTVVSRCVETPLATAVRTPAPDEDIILRALAEAVDGRDGVASAFRFARVLQDVLARRRESIAAESDKAWREEAARWKQADDRSVWASEREAQAKAASEAAVLRERDEILQILCEAFGDALRSLYGAPGERPVSAGIARRYSRVEILRRLDVLEALRIRLAFGVQENLALEAGVLELICSPSQPDLRTSAERSAL